MIPLQYFLFLVAFLASALSFANTLKENGKDGSVSITAESVSTLWGQLLGEVQKRIQTDFDQPLRIRPLSGKWEEETKKFSTFTIESTLFDPRDKRITAKIIFRDSANNTYPFQFLGTVVFLKRVPIFKESLSPGQECKPEDLRWQVLEEDYRLRDVITDPAILQGAIVKRTIHSGDMPTWKNIKTCDEIERGELVELIYKAGNLTITLAGAQALGKGRTGDTITVLSPMASKKGKSLFGVIEKNRRVRINTVG